MPDEYDKIRENFNPPERGRIFENGTEAVFHDREKGYVSHPDPYSTLHGQRYYDKARTDALGKVHAIDDKSGQTGSKNDIRELKKDRELLATREIETLTIRTVAGEKMSAAYERRLNELRNEFGARVIHVEISRAQARDVFAKGLDREKNAQQLELSGVREKAREGKAKALENRREQIAEIAKARERKERARQRLENIRKIEQARAERERMAIAAEQAARSISREAPVPGFFTRTISDDQSIARGVRENAERIAREERETRQHEQDRDRELAKTAETREQIKVMNAELAQGIEEQAREINSAWDKGEAVAVENVREAHTDLSRNLEAIREAELVQARNDFLVSGHTQEEVQAIEPRLEQIREDNRHEIVQGINTLGAIVERGDQTRDHADREAAAERQRDQERAAQREAARAQDAARQAACERLQEQGRLTDAERALWLGQATDPHAAVRERPGTAPQVQGLGRDGHGQSRGISRDR
ncbi:hypothetical protein F5X71_29790 [Nocardia brasiliensis]|uniref:Uncharacterized protein n=1 Tax=Nocardia brasiliensis TaxID=37326 RepID=A0A6G9XYP6_NOCBR|nr:hypothetical protein [Nocardia brasiliensis]QIS05943.1 hypothetical protein F5X71_29790 [Nocardia brasiliensis]